MASVVLKGVEKTYANGFKAVHGVDLEVRDGEFMVFVGPSGCAKSTLLRMVAGLESITAGDLLIGGKRVNELPARERGVAMVFQNYALYPHMTVFDNLAFGLKLAGVSKSEINRRVGQAAETLEMGHLLSRYPKQLSGGQAQRVAVGRAIVKQPAVFLFDEPLSNLDAKLRAAMRVRLSELHRDLRAQGHPATVIYVTHDQTEAMTMGERICVLKEGHIQQVDVPVTLYNKPVNSFVAGFIGSPEMNLLNVTCQREGDQLSIDIEDQSFEFVSPGNFSGNQVMLGIRPEHLSLQPKDDSVRLHTKLKMMEHMGGELYVYLDLANTGICLRVASELAGQVWTLPRGSAIDVYACVRHLHCFDVQTGQRI